MSDGSEPTVTQGSVESAGSRGPVAALTSDPAPAAPARASATSPRPAPTCRRSGAWWTLPSIAAGLCIIAIAMVVGQVEENRQIAWQKNKLQMDLDHFKEQARVNQEFLSRLETDANLAERLAQQQMKLVREGAAVLDLKDASAKDDKSPFRFVHIPPPPEVKPYEPAPGLLTATLSTPRARGFAFGLGALLVAVGLIAGAPGTRTNRR